MGQLGAARALQNTRTGLPVSHHDGGRDPWAGLAPLQHTFQAGGRGRSQDRLQDDIGQHDSSALRPIGNTYESQDPYHSAWQGGTSEHMAQRRNDRPSFAPYVTDDSDNYEQLGRWPHDNGAPDTTDNLERDPRLTIRDENGQPDESYHFDFSKPPAMQANNIVDHFASSAATIDVEIGPAARGPLVQTIHTLLTEIEQA